MSDVLTDTVTYLQSLAKSIAGIRAAPAKPQDNTIKWPIAVSICRHVPWESGVSNMEMVGICTFGTQIHVDRSDAARDYLAVHHFGVDYPLAIWKDLKLGGRVNHVQAVRARFATMRFGGIETVGWDFEIDAEIKIAQT